MTVSPWPHQQDTVKKNRPFFMVVLKILKCDNVTNSCVQLAVPLKGLLLLFFGRFIQNEVHNLHLYFFCHKYITYLIRSTRNFSNSHIHFAWTAKKVKKLPVFASVKSVTTLVKRISLVLLRRQHNMCLAQTPRAGEVPGCLSSYLEANKCFLSPAYNKDLQQSMLLSIRC